MNNKIRTSFCNLLIIFFIFSSCRLGGNFNATPETVESNLLTDSEKGTTKDSSNSTLSDEEKAKLEAEKKAQAIKDAAISASAFEFSLTEDTSLTKSLSASSLEGVTFTYEISTQPSHGTVTLSGDSFTYTPTANYFGTDSFYFIATGSNGNKSSATKVSLSITNAYDAIVAVNDSSSTGYNTALTLSAATLISNDTNTDNVSLSTIASVGNASNGTISLAGDNSSVIFTPTNGFAGTGSFEYSISDGTTTSTATVSISVELCSASAQADSAPYNSSGTYVICSPNQFIWIAADTARWAFSYLLGVDLDFSGKTLTPIGNNTTKFTGNFNGNNKTMSNITFSSTATYHGLFGATENNTIENLNVIYTSFTTNHHYSGGIAGYSNITTFSGINVTFNAFEATNANRIGGIVGYADTTTINTSNAIFNTSFSASGISSWGGIAGYLNSSNITTASVSGTAEIYINNPGTEYLSAYMIWTGSAIGGAVGYFSSFTGGAATFSITKFSSSINIRVTNTSNVNTTYYNIGGVVGRAYTNWGGRPLVVTQSKNTGNISTVHSGTTYHGSNVGGLIGNSSNTDVKAYQNYSTGNIQGWEYVGGIVGGTAVVAINNWTSATITGYRYVGGILGTSDVINSYVFNSVVRSTSITATSGSDAEPFCPANRIKFHGNLYDSSVTTVSGFNGSNPKGQSYSQTDLKQRNLYITLGFDFDQAWVSPATTKADQANHIMSGFPVFQWENSTAVAAQNELTPRDLFDVTSQNDTNSSQANPIVISTADHLANMGFWVNIADDFDAYFKINADIDASSLLGIAIGAHSTNSVYYEYFRGGIDGSNGAGGKYQISNIQFKLRTSLWNDSAYTAVGGIIPIVGEGGSFVMKDIAFEFDTFEVYASGTYNISPIIGRLNVWTITTVSITNVDVIVQNYSLSDSLLYQYPGYASSVQAVGGLIGGVNNSSTGTLEQISVTLGSVAVSNVFIDKFGGVFGNLPNGLNASSISFSNTNEMGFFTSGYSTYYAKNVGGIVGDAANGSLTNVTSGMKIRIGTHLDPNARIGGIVGYQAYGSISKAKFTGSIYTRSSNNSIFYTGNEIGGICGNCIATSISEAVVENATIHGTFLVGGIAGVFDNYLNKNVDNSRVANSSIKGISYVGGVFGNTPRSVTTLTNSYVAANEVLATDPGNFTAPYQTTLGVGNNPILGHGLWNCCSGFTTHASNYLTVSGVFYDDTLLGFGAGTHGTQSTTTEMQTTDANANGKIDLFETASYDQAKWDLSTGRYPVLLWE